MRGEEEAEQARIEADRRAREEEIRRAKEAEEAKRRAEEDRIRRDIEEKERIVREHDLRLKESERRAQIEAAAKLEQARIEAEARARIEGKKFPTMQVVGGVVALVVLAGAHHGLPRLQPQRRSWRAAGGDDAAGRAGAQAARRAEQARQQALQKQLDDLQAQLDKATNDAERAQIRAKIAATAAAKTSRPASSRVGVRVRRRPEDDVEAGRQGHQRSARRPRSVAPLLALPAPSARRRGYDRRAMPLFSRPDGTLVTGLSPVRYIMPFLMRGRNESAVLHEARFDLSRTHEWLTRWSATTRASKASLFHLVLWAVARTLHERAGLNRFVSGGRIYQRNGVFLSFAAKTTFDDDAPIVTIKLEFPKEDTFAACVERWRTVGGAPAGDGRRRREEEHRRQGAGAGDGAPGVVLRGVMALLRWLDRVNLMPAGMIASDPMYASAFWRTSGRSASTTRSTTCTSTGR